MPDTTKGNQVKIGNYSDYKLAALADLLRPLASDVSALAIVAMIEVEQARREKLDKYLPDQYLGDRAADNILRDLAGVFEEERRSDPYGGEINGCDAVDILTEMANAAERLLQRRG